MAAAAAPATGSGAGAGKAKRKRSLSEDDVYTLLHRYSPTTILTVLHEVAQHAEARRKINWRALVAKTASGISSAREYQMLWRYVAYNHDLAESVDAGSAPLGDDSDIEYELEAVPNPGSDALSEASVCAKVVLSGSSREQASGHRVNAEAPALNSPNEKIARVPSDKQLAQSHRLTNVTGPVSSSKQACHVGPSPDPLDANGAPNKKKKKLKAWSKEEDVDLADGVQKYGEGNWQEILNNSNIDNTRTTSQLSHRWAQICKRPGLSRPVITTKQANVTSSEERMAAQMAFTMALDMPMGVKSTLKPGAQQQSCQHPSTMSGSAIHEVKSAAVPSQAPVPGPVPATTPVPVKVQAQSPLPQGQQVPAQIVPPKVPNALNKTRNNSKKQAVQTNPTIGPSSIQAAAIAAGGRIATATTAAKFLKAAQSKNAVHIRSRATGSQKPSTSYKAPVMVVEPVTQHSGIQHLEPPNTSAAISGPSIPTMQASQKVQVVSEVAAVNPPVLSAGVQLLETKKASSTAPVPASCANEEKDGDSEFFVVTIDDLFPEEAMQRETLHPKAKEPDPVGPKAKQPDTVGPKVEEIVDSKDADMLEFDRFVAAQGGCVNMDIDKSEPVTSATRGKGFVGCQKRQLKPVTEVGKISHISSGAPATGKRTRTPVPHFATPTPPVPARGSVGTGNDSQNKTLGRKAAAPATMSGQNPLPSKLVANTKGNQIHRNSEGSPGIPASNQGNVAVNVASKVNPPSRSQGNVAMNVASKVNPPSSIQGNVAVNVASKVNPPSSSQGNVAVNVASKVNPPSSSQGNVAVNVASKVNPPSSSQVSTVANGARKVNPPSSSNGSTAVNGAGKVNPPG